MEASTICRFATDDRHVCANSDGTVPPRPGTDCYAEARAQLQASSHRTTVQLVYRDGSYSTFVFSGPLTRSACRHGDCRFPLGAGAPPGIMPDLICDYCRGLFLREPPNEIIFAPLGARVCRWLVSSKSRAGLFHSVKVWRQPEGSPMVQCSCERGDFMASIYSPSCEHMRRIVEGGYAAREIWRTLS